MSVLSGGGDGTVVRDPAPVLAPNPASLARLAMTLLPAWGWWCLVLVGAYIAIGHAVGWAMQLPVHWPVAHLTKQAGLVFLIAYVPLVGAYFVDGFFGPRARVAHLREHLLSPRFFLELVVAMTAVHATLMVFVNLKQFVPTINPTLYDSPLWRLDAWLHFGFDPAVVATELAAEHGLLDFLDQAYLVYFPVQVLVPLLFLLSARLRPKRGAFFFAYCLLWMLGSLVYILWPSLGPVYYRGSRFVWLDQAPYAQHIQTMLMQDYLRFRQDPAYYAVKLYRGVAALPSLHVGVITLFAMATWRWRALSLLLWGLAAVTFVGSLALGWHYAVDGYAGALLAWGAWWAGCALCGPRRGESA